ncbi:MAG TPA: tRNA (adenosine(37)-N6)-threonylcarbamoyltransferase complex dimerization subunit type 1 TsaB [Myxococcota bacterium]
MLLLAIETATPETSAALLRDGRLLAEERGAAGRPTAETLLPAVDALLHRSATPLAAVEAFAVSIGPGSFTSLRIGLATVKGLAFGSRRPAVPVPTLRALARTAPAGEGPVVALLDARRGELYAAAFEGADLAPSALLPEGVYTVDALGERLPESCRLTGQGVAVCGEALRALRGPGVVCVPEAVGVARAAHVGALGARLLAEGAGIDAGRLVPYYLRRAEAEVKRTGRRFEGAGARAGGGARSRIDEAL